MAGSQKNTQAVSKADFQKFLTEEAEKVRGLYVPVKSPLIRRIFIWKVPCRSLHPNPEDEFCDPKIGPNYQIISDYEQQLSDLAFHGQKMTFDKPLVIEKTRPDGYLILNGEHRWAAALRMGLKRVPARIVNLTQKEDIKKMVSAAKHSRRVTLDLDEVVLSTDGGAAEKALPFPMNRLFKENLRLGVPALFRFLNNKGYDVWVYSAQYYSFEYIRRLFSAHQVHVTGIVTGAARKTKASDREQVEALLKNKYPVTFHIDKSAVVRVDRESGAFEEHPLSGRDDTWSREIMDVIEKAG